MPEGDGGKVASLRNRPYSIPILSSKNIIRQWKISLVRNQSTLTPFIDEGNPLGEGVVEAGVKGMVAGAIAGPAGVVAGNTLKGATTAVTKVTVETGVDVLGEAAAAAVEAIIEPSCTSEDKGC